MDSLEEHELKLLQRQVAHQRDATAYRRIFLYFYPSALRFSTAIIRDKSLAEEAVSDVMMNIWLLDRKLAKIKNLRTYLFSALRNKALDYLKSNKQYRSHVAITADSVVDQQSPEAAAITAEATATIFSAIDSLPPKCKTVFLLVRESHCSYREVAAIMDISEHTVNRHIQQAIKHLRVLLKKKFNFL